MSENPHKYIAHNGFWISTPINTETLMTLIRDDHRRYLMRNLHANFTIPIEYDIDYSCLPLHYKMELLIIDPTVVSHFTTLELPLIIRIIDSDNIENSVIRDFNLEIDDLLCLFTNPSGRLIHSLYEKYVNYPDKHPFYSTDDSNISKALSIRIDQLSEMLEDIDNIVDDSGNASSYITGNMWGFFRLMVREFMRTSSPTLIPLLQRLSTIIIETEEITYHSRNMVYYLMGVVCEVYEDDKLIIMLLDAIMEYFSTSEKIKSYTITALKRYSEGRPDFIASMFEESSNLSRIYKLAIIEETI